MGGDGRRKRGSLHDRSRRGGAALGKHAGWVFGGASQRRDDTRDLTRPTSGLERRLRSAEALSFEAKNAGEGVALLVAKDEFPWEWA